MRVGIEWLEFERRGCAIIRFAMSRCPVGRVVDLSVRIEKSIGRYADVRTLSAGTACRSHTREIRAGKAGHAVSRSGKPAIR